ncbi:hypothetical protein F5884DRAFT_854680 [Xylogone sp. PMI_703]|nr:hypothetical protein F5884DRAFT_854680 [Xylogone sp. PMI_703]
MENRYSRIDQESSDDELLEGDTSQSSRLKTTILRGKHFLSIDDSKPLRKGSSPFYSSPCIKLLKDITLFSLAFWGLFSIFTRITTNYDIRAHSQILQGCDCGDSVAEAISRGCKFDSLAMAWLPEHCRDDDLTAEFNTAGNGPNGTWVYYADARHTIEVDPNEVAAMGDNSSARVHMNEHWHTIHCIFYWRKQFRTKLTGKIVEPRSDTEHHIKHCGEILQKPGYGTVSGVALNTNEE